MGQGVRGTAVLGCNVPTAYTSSNAPLGVCRMGQSTSVGRDRVPPGRKPRELETLVTPDTLLRWYRELVASQWNYNHRRGPGRPRVMKTIVNSFFR